MSQWSARPEEPSVEDVSRRFDAWRKTRKLHEPIPDELWKAAAGLCEYHRPYIIARKLRLNYNKLKAQVDDLQAELPTRKSPAEAGFVDLGFASAHTAVEYVIEIQDHKGGKMRLQAKGHHDLDPVKICQAFWSKGS